MTIEIEIDHLTEAELLDLNHRIVARIDYLRASTNYAAMLEFRIGDRVTFETSAGEPVVGTLIRFNRKTVAIVTDTRDRWNIAPTLLQKVAALEAEDGASNVVPFERRDRDEG